MNAQKQLYDIVNSDQYVAFPDDKMQVASTVIDVASGQVRAQIGGRHIPDDVQLGNNLAVNTQRDVGSTVKPIMDYGPAIENLNYSTGRLMVDKPTKYPGTDIDVFNSDLTYQASLLCAVRLWVLVTRPRSRRLMKLVKKTSCLSLKG